MKVAPQQYPVACGVLADFPVPPLDVSCLERIEGVESVKRRDRQYRLTIGRNLKRLTGVLLELDRQNVVPIGLSTHQATLDDVFLALTGRGLSAEEASE